ncbi:MAG: cytochrome b/b6 domain-containing protein [Gammaproteobacteria bacterium]|nr:cytochrome b/b6 domain-containing protein [Gammaproteobacteria bacterium]
MNTEPVSNIKAGALVWDLPTRIFHWLLVLSFTAAWLSHDDNRYLDVHVYMGYLFLGLLVFRLAWGLVGSHYSRFHSFAYDWSSVWSYLGALASGRASRYLGHNPAGSWAIFLLIVLGFVVSLLGIVVFGAEEGHGPLANMFSFAVSAIAREAHEISAWLMLAVVCAHILGVIVESLVHRENLIWAMVTGYKQQDGTAPSLVSRHGTVGVLLFMSALGFMAFSFRGYLTETAGQQYRPFTGPALPENAVWREVCGECHLAYYPTLLPARSWQKMMQDQADHFGEDLGMDNALVTNILTFLTANSAESHLTETAWKVDISTPAEEIPLRVTETPYWQKKHKKIPERYWKHEQVTAKGNCEGCHLDAKEGTFEDAAMRLPE